MSLPETDYIRHMLDEARYLRERSATLKQDEFDADPTLQRAFVRSLEIIGEAAKHISDPFRNRYPTVPWRVMAGLRDRVIHDYLGVDYELVWDVVRNKMPELQTELERILAIEDMSNTTP
uniref:Uncharacterized conserved protein, contains HEPN domain n=1 Tax=Candidatus Kentrum eta TaxID=2126337 RepID=A0A450U9S1_9GAMM|nr:MAG: Uncharacterized conserved protein, contains HEPN domain [Candidatus Kentron sp. H]VFJ88845.1 MAG: Uncharacterized conserved protein, contains HEPN domain [Candidatus Kentron sp. H]VFJ95092.1 MAG: Uncharacterized conserved protein, contains HEPN domain [Candidatus Kentron sp. H]